MSKTVQKIYILLLAVLVLLGGSYAYRYYSLKSDKEFTVSALELYYETHSHYPKSLEELKSTSSDRFYYYPDSSLQSFRLGYSSGIMESTNNYYDSQTKQWFKEFVY